MSCQRYQTISVIEETGQELFKIIMHIIFYYNLKKVIHEDIGIIHHSSNFLSKFCFFLRPKFWFFFRSKFATKIIVILIIDNAMNYEIY